MSFIAEKRRLTAGSAAAETQRGEVKSEAGERSARRAGYVFVAVGLLLMLLSAGGSLADVVRGLETGVREDLGLGYLLDRSGYDFVGAEADQDLLSPDHEEAASGGDRGEAPLRPEGSR